MKPNFYKQTDSRWARKRYRVPGGSPSVGGSGCGPTSMCNVISALNHPTLKPDDVFKWVCKHGYMTAGQGMYWSGIKATLKHYGITTVKTIYHNSDGKAKLKSYLKRGYWAIAIMHRGDWTSGGHFILPYRVKGNIVYISDPASYASSRARASYDRFWAQNDCDWAIIDPTQYAKAKPAAKPKPKKAATTKVELKYVGDDYANVRKGRSTSYTKVGALDFNTAVKVTSFKDGWYKIASGKFKGYYICDHTLSKYKQNKCKYKTCAVMNVRNGYTTKSDVIAQISKGRTVVSTKQRGRWAWIPSAKGWVCIKAENNTYLKAVK